MFRGCSSLSYIDINSRELRIICRDLDFLLWTNFSKFENSK